MIKKFIDAIYAAGWLTVSIAFLFTASFVVLGISALLYWTGVTETLDSELGITSGVITFFSIFLAYSLKRF